MVMREKPCLLVIVVCPLPDVSTDPYLPAAPHFLRFSNTGAIIAPLEGFQSNVKANSMIISSNATE